MGYLTPDIVPGDVVCRGLFVPNDEAYLAIVRGLLQTLTFPSSWDKFGTLTQQQAADACVDMFDRFCLEKDVCRMVGELIAYAGAVSPKDTWLVCDGSQVSQETYPDLYNVIGDTYGAADTGNFRLPDLRCRALAGTGTLNSHTLDLGDTYGAETHTLTTAEMPAHSHTDTGHQHTTGNSITIAAVVPGEGPVLAPNPIPSLTGSASANLTNTGGGEAHSTVGPRIGITYLIVAKDG